MTFQLQPRIYSLLLCSTAKENRQTGGWLVEPFSEVQADRLPIPLQAVLFAQIMAPPGSYEMAIRLFHSTDPEHTLHMLSPRTFTIQEGKNLDFLLNLEMRISQVGLHIIEAAIPGHHVMQTPLRVVTTLRQPKA